MQKYHCDHAVQMFVAFQDEFNSTQLEPFCCKSRAEFFKKKNRQSDLKQTKRCPDFFKKMTGFKFQSQ